MARPRASDFEEKRQGLLDSAASIFAEQGLEKASMSQIAAHAGVSKALLYHYYPSKVVLLFEILATHLNELQNALASTEAELAGATPEARLEALIVTVLEQYRGADAHHKVQLNAFGTLEPDQQAAIQKIERQIVGHFSTTLQALRPDLPREQVMPLTMSVFGMLNWVYMWFRDGGRMSRADYGRMAAQMVIGGLPAVEPLPVKNV